MHSPLIHSKKEVRNNARHQSTHGRIHFPSMNTYCCTEQLSWTFCVSIDPRLIRNPVAYVGEGQRQVCILGVHSALGQQPLPLLHIRPLLVLCVVRLVGPDRVSSMRACSGSCLLLLHGDQRLPRLPPPAAVVRGMHSTALCTTSYASKGVSCLSRCGCRGYNPLGSYPGFPAGIPV